MLASDNHRLQQSYQSIGGASPAASPSAAIAAIHPAVIDGEVCIADVTIE